MNVDPGIPFTRICGIATPLKTIFQAGSDWIKLNWNYLASKQEVSFFL